MVPAADEVLEDAAQEDRQADADHHHRDQPGAALAQRAPQAPVLSQPKAPGDDERHDDRDDDRHVGAADADGAGQAVDGEARPARRR